MAGLGEEITVTVDLSGNIIDVSGNIEQVFGWSPEELIGEKVENLIPYKYRERHRAGWTRWVQTGEKRAMGTWMAIEGKHKNGNIFSVSMVLTERIIGDTRQVTALFVTSPPIAST